MSNPAGIPDGAAPVQQLNFAAGANGAFGLLLMNLITNNTSGAPCKLLVYLAMDGAQIGSWPVTIDNGYDNKLFCLRLPNISAGGHYFINYMWASVSGVNIYSSEMGLLELKA